MNNKYDEKQQMDRGKGFQYGFIAAIAVDALIYLAEDAMGIKISGFASFLIQVWTPLTVCMLTFIIKDAMNGIREQTGRILAVSYGACGFFMLCLAAAHIISGKEALLSNGVITEEVGHLYIAVCMIAASITYWVRQRLNQKKYDEE
ncbi:hypothetical protein LQE92_11780 [Lacrimispora sp. NSJ-141]|uniref:Uncharacterized protein n=1 Tax=Lientehia hominis TaxID=2897778 RepID=A0AAP2RKN6_9FIRM|nr:hypothetical protein [Lientehia hominis]MCD2493294.1 hypothetical protein [Lientehia hominis]